VNYGSLNRPAEPESEQGRSFGVSHTETGRHKYRIFNKIAKSFHEHEQSFSAPSISSRSSGLSHLPFSILDWSKA
jgi:hypothetical protein